MKVTAKRDAMKLEADGEEVEFYLYSSSSILSPGGRSVFKSAVGNLNKN